jgi:hypothetical protein
VLAPTSAGGECFFPYGRVTRRTASPATLARWRSEPDEGVERAAAFPGRRQGACRPGSPAPLDPTLARRSMDRGRDRRDGRTFRRGAVARLPRPIGEACGAKRPHSAPGHLSPAWFEGIGTREAG